MHGVLQLSVQIQRQVDTIALQLPNCSHRRPQAAAYRRFGAESHPFGHFEEDFVVVDAQAEPSGVIQGPSGDYSLEGLGGERVDLHHQGEWSVG